MSAIKLSTPSSGSISLSPADTASNLTITVPAVTGTMLTTASTGAVLQVVEASTTTAVTSSTATYIDTTLTATITPSSASNKILVIVTQHCYKSAGSSNNAPNIKLFRNATDLGRTVYANFFTGTAVEIYGMTAFQYLDSPSTTSATTYKTQFANNVNASSSVVQADSNGRSTIILMEIAG
jgi:hypothetical protein